MCTKPRMGKEYGKRNGEFLTLKLLRDGMRLCLSQTTSQQEVPVVWLFGRRKKHGFLKNNNKKKKQRLLQS